jgi:uncharacterized membrane protein
METTGTAPAARSSSTIFTAALGLAVAFVVLLFAFNSSWYGNWYATFRVLHVVLAVLWVGGGILLTILGLRAERSDDPNEMATLAGQAAFAGERIFAPAGLLVLLLGIAMMVNTDLGWSQTWVIVGLAGYAVTFATGIGVLSPLAKKLGANIAELGAEHPGTQGTIRRILMIARVDVAVLIVVVADMVVKPFS